MNRTDRKSFGASTKAAAILLAVIVYVILTGGWASAQQGSGLSAVGGVDPAIGYPKWYMDGSGLQLAPCLDTTAGDPCLLAGTFPNPGAAISFPGNFPDEFMYWLATADITGVGVNRSGTAILVLDVTGAFGGPTGTPADGAGAQIAFARFRLRVKNSLTPGATYTMTGPLGSQAFVADGTGTINFTDDRGCLVTPPACDFTLALNQPNAGPFLRWDATGPAPPAGFIGDPAILHPITGSPFGNNFFRLDGPNVGGLGVNTIQTNLFSVIGKIFVRPATTTTLTASPNPSTVGQAVTLTATVRPVAPATGVPTGSVSFRDGATTIETATLDATGTASIVVSTLGAGNHSLTAVYAGSPDFQTSTSAVVTQVVRAATTTTLSSTPNPSTAGQGVTLTATVLPVAPATGVPTGSVSFRDGTTTIGSATLGATGTASIVVSTLTAGSHSLTAAYAGAGNFLASTSPVVTQVVNAPAASTTTTLTSAPNPSTTGQAVTLTATVSPVAPATGTPTGTVTFRDGTTTIGSATLGGNGTASIIVSTLAAGSHSLTAAYGGSANFLASTSAVMTQVVNAPPAPGTDTVTITRAQLILRTGELRVDGVNTPIGLATSVEIHSDGAVGTSCPGPLIATTPVRGSNAHWSFRDVISFSPATICVKSDGGGVATSAVTPK